MPKWQRPGAQDERVAIVGMAVTYAGCANKEQFWDRLMENKCNSGPISAERLGTNDKQLHYNKARSKYSDTFCNDRYATIDPSFTNEHDLLLSLARAALDDAKARKNNHPDAFNRSGKAALGAGIDASRTGIVSGCLSFPRDNLQGELLNVYQAHVEKKFAEVFEGAPLFNDAESPWSSRGEETADALDARGFMDPASFVAKELGLGGQHYCIDAACATALYVLRLAQEHLLSGKVDAMLCGASTLPDPFFILSGFSTFQAMPVAGTKEDISLPWNKHSTGLTPGEGGAIMVMKRLSDAVRDGDHIYGVLLSVGINNAGCGLPLKPHMPSELSCMQETYDQIDAVADVSYVECHATGTSQGDRVEIDAMDRCFAKLPLFGSTKGNFGHTLVAAGFAGMTKLLLAMEKGVIPPTPGVDDSSAMSPNVVRVPTAWPTSGVKRAALSAFGFGGTNAHALFEDYVPGNAASPERTLRAKFPTLLPLAIKGMDCHFGTLVGLDAFEQALYHGRHGGRPLPESRWRFLGKDEDFLRVIGAKAAPAGCFVDGVGVDFKRIRTPLTPEDMLIPQQLIALKTMDKACMDAGLRKGERVAVLVGLGTDLELYRHRARVALKERLHSRMLEEGSAVERLMDYIHDRGTSTSYTSYIGNLIATRLSSQWNFTGPAFSVTEGENSVFRCIELAQLLLTIGHVSSVVVAGVDLCGSAEAVYLRTKRLRLSASATPQAPFSANSDGFFIGEGAGALVLSRAADLSSPTKVYATIDGLATAPSSNISDCAAKALAQAGTDGASVEYLDVSGDARSHFRIEPARAGRENLIEPVGVETEIDSLAQVYDGRQRSVAVSTARSTVGYVGYASGAASVIKTALCLFNRYLSETPQYKNPSAPFPPSMYVCPNSRAWVKDKPSDRRLAAVSSLSETGSYAHVILSDVSWSHEKRNRFSCDPAAPKVLSVCGSSTEDILSQLRNPALTYDQLSATARTPVKTALVLSLVASRESFKQEVAAALKGIPRAERLGRDYVSAAGSYFTPRPVRSEKVAFMYGEGRSPYVGLGRDLYRIWPGLHEFIQSRTTEMFAENGDDEFHPRRATKAEMEEAKEAFDHNMISMFRSGVFHSLCFTGIATEMLGLKPAASFGLSLGEVSMLFAFSKKNSLCSDKMTKRLAASKVWNTELAVQFNAVRSKWGFPLEDPLEKHWKGYMVQGSREEIEAAIGGREDVRLMIVHNSAAALIAGKVSACKKVIQKLRKPALELQQRMIGHCPEVVPYVEEIERMHEQIEIPQVEHKIYTTVGNKVIPAGTSAGKLAGQIYTSIADFPQIVQKVHADGHKVYIELGANNHRSLAVQDILKGKQVVSVSIDKENVPAWQQLCRMVAALNSHQVPGLHMEHLYHEGFGLPTKVNKFFRTIALNGRFKGISSDVIDSPLRTDLARSNTITKLVPAFHMHPHAEKLQSPLRVAPIQKPMLQPSASPAAPRSSKKTIMKRLQRENGLEKKRAQMDALIELEEEKKVEVDIGDGASLRDCLREIDRTFDVHGDTIEAVTYRDLGEQSFLDTYNVIAPLYTGAMAKGIASAELVIAAGRRGILASFGAGGLPMQAVEASLDKIQSALPNGPFAVNLIHSPFNENLERGNVDLFLRRGVTVVEASAFMALTPQVVRYRVSGLERAPDGSVRVKHRLIAKVSRTELAEMFLRPAPKQICDKLVRTGEITAEQAELARQVPMADDIAVEADSGGHTDNRPIHVILPIIIQLRNRVHRECGFPARMRVRVGAGGGIGCPSSARAVFNMGAAFVVTGSVNQMARQSGTSDIVRKALSEATYSDIAMAPAADMFDQGVELQVLKKGTMFPSRAKKLYELFCKYDSLDDIPVVEMQRLEKRVFRKPIAEVWEETKDFYINRLHDEAKIKHAEKDGKLKMSLCFRWYLGLSSLWANTGVKNRQMDYQVWCGPAIGAFNDFISGTYLDVRHPASQGNFPCVVQTNLQILHGACYLQRAQQLHTLRGAKDLTDMDDIMTYKPTTPL